MLACLTIHSRTMPLAVPMPLSRSISPGRDGDESNRNGIHHENRRKNPADDIIVEERICAKRVTQPSRADKTDQRGRIECDHSQEREQPGGNIVKVLPLNFARRPDSSDSYLFPSLKSRRSGAGGIHRVSLTFLTRLYTQFHEPVGHAHDVPASIKRGHAPCEIGADDVAAGVAMVGGAPRVLSIALP